MGERTATGTKAAAGAEPRRGSARVAIFDLDRTLVPGSSLVPLARHLARSGLLGRGKVVGAVARNARFAKRGADESTAERLLAEALAAVAGVAASDVRAAVVDAAADVAARVRPAMRSIVRRHIVAGDLCVLLSAAPHELVHEVARLSDLDVGIGTRVEVRHGLITGRLDGPFCHGHGKLARLRDELHGIELATATVYTDAGSDLPLLEACGFPVAVRPDRTLRTAAIRAGWPILQH